MSINWSRTCSCSPRKKTRPAEIAQRTRRESRSHDHKSPQETHRSRPSRVLNPANRIQYDNWLERGIKPTAFSLKQLLRAIFVSAPLSRVMMRHNPSLNAIGETLRRRRERVRTTLDHVIGTGAPTTTQPIPPAAAHDEEREHAGELRAMDE